MLITSSCDCSVIAFWWSGKIEDGWHDCKTSFPRAKFTRQVFCSFLSAPMIPLFHACGHQMRSFWVTGTTRFESVDITCQIWPIKGYTRSWYTGTSCLKKWLQAQPLFLSPVSSPFCFVFVLVFVLVFSCSQFSRPDYLRAWNRLGWEVRVHLEKNLMATPQ